MTKLRAKGLEEAAQLNEMPTWTESGNIPVCPDCKKIYEDVNSTEQGTRNAILVFGHNRRAQGKGNTNIYPVTHAIRETSTWYT